jgi:acyl-CoA hydrolase
MGGMGPGEAVEVVGGVNGVGSGSVEIRSVEIRAKVRRDQSISVKIRKIAASVVVVVVVEEWQGRGCDVESPSHSK